MAIGDECMITATKGVNKNQANIPFETKRLGYDRIQNSVYSPSMVSFVHDSYGFLGYFPTPTCDRPCKLCHDATDLTGKGEKPETYYLDFATPTLKKIDDFATDNLSIPMDFNGSEVVWLK